MSERQIADLPQRECAPQPVPTLWQTLAALQDGSIDLRTAHHLVKALTRAAEHRGKRQRMEG